MTVLSSKQSPEKMKVIGRLRKVGKSLWKGGDDVEKDRNVISDVMVGVAGGKIPLDTGATVAYLGNASARIENAEDKTARRRGEAEIRGEVEEAQRMIDERYGFKKES